MLSESNFLILDEPTNHLDITSKEILEDALNRYTGTVFYVSHDRYFINRTATRILELTGQSFLNYIGNYDYYLEKKDVIQGLLTEASAKASSPESKAQKSSPETSKALDWKAQKEEQARIRKRQNDLKRTEEEIHKLETRSGEIDELLTREDICRDVPKLMELNREKEALEETLTGLYDLWETLAGEDE